MHNCNTAVCKQRVFVEWNKLEVVETSVTKRIKCVVFLSYIYIHTHKCFIEESFRVFYVNLSKLQTIC